MGVDKIQIKRESHSYPNTFNSICFLFGKKKPSCFHDQRAFTLVELLVALAVIVALSNVAVPLYREYVERANEMQAIADIYNIDTQMAAYELANNGGLPDTLADIGMDTLRDPWGNPYQYLNLSDPKIKGAKGKARKDHNLVPINSDFDLYSMGKDGQSVPPLTGKLSRDDIVRANNGRFVGKASDY